MTREEAIAFGKRVIDLGFKDETQAFCELAIKALEQELCEDISEDGTLNVNVEDGSKVSRVLVCGDNHFGGLYYSEPKWIPVSEQLPETDNENSINNYNVLLWVKNKSHPEREPQIYLGKLRHIDGDDGSGNFWGIETKPCDWSIWGWCYFNEPEVIAWMPLPEPYKAESK